MQPSDLTRELTKAHVALSHAAAYLQRCDQAEAVRRLVMPEALTYSPLTTEVVNAHGSLGQVIQQLTEPRTAEQDADTVNRNARASAELQGHDPASVDAQTVRADTGLDEPKLDQRCTLCGVVNPEADLCSSDESGGHVLEPARSTDG